MQNNSHGIAHLYTERPETWQLLQSLRENHTVWQPEYTRTLTENGEVVAHAVIVKCWIDSFPAHLLAALAGEGSASTRLLRELIDQLATDARTHGVPACLLVHADEHHSPDFYAALGLEPARFEGIKTPAPIAKTHFLALNLNPDVELSPGTVIYPPEYYLDESDDL